VNERWECASTRPGIRVAPCPSTTMALPAASDAAAGTTAAIRLPSTSTEPAKAGAPVQSRTLTFLKKRRAHGPQGPARFFGIYRFSIYIRFQVGLMIS